MQNCFAVPTSQAKFITAFCFLNLFTQTMSWIQFLFKFFERFLNLIQIRWVERGFYLPNDVPYASAFTLHIKIFWFLSTHEREPIFCITVQLNRLNEQVHKLWGSNDMSQKLEINLLHGKSPSKKNTVTPKQSRNLKKARNSDFNRRHTILLIIRKYFQCLSADLNYVFYRSAMIIGIGAVNK